MELKKKLKEYARLIVRTGANVQKNQDVVVSISVTNFEFAHMLVKEAYEAGAREVIVFWNDIETSRMKYDYGNIDIFEKVPDWLAESRNYYAQKKAAFINITGNDPEAFKGVDSEKLKLNAKATHKAFETYYKKTMNSEVQWCVAAVPQLDWAKKVYPDCADSEAMDKLWEAILFAVRVDDGDSVEKWQIHNSFLREKCEQLNKYHFKSLHYSNSLGTDLTIGLHPKHQWEGGAEISKDGIDFVANMPTEEIFTCPNCYEADGRVVAAMPLSYQGNIIDKFTLTFKDGEVVDYSAEIGLEILKVLLESDEGAKRLGEVALVPDNSPISNMGILFYETLFDENAACHLALGECYPTTICGGEKLSTEELKSSGGNKSQVHVDFMIGTSDLNISGITEEGEIVPIFKNGNWI
ncbi:aminopeptidase [Eubacteriaceae bacterium ES3]|nr:aminopeptidase [Eubacteriaceae bacterium ES3]